MKREEVARELVKAARELAGASRTKKSVDVAHRAAKAVYGDLEDIMEDIQSAQDALHDEGYDQDVDQYLIDAWNALLDSKSKVSAAMKALRQAASGGI